MINKIKNDKGLTLIEIIVTIAILGIVIIPISSLFISAGMTNKISNDKMAANILAQNKMEEIKANTIIDLGSSIETEGTFTIETTVTEIDKYKFTTTSQMDYNNLNYDILINTYNEGEEIIIKNKSNSEISTMYTVINASLEKNKLICSTETANITQNIQGKDAEINIFIHGDQSIQLNCVNNKKNKNLKVYIVKDEDKEGECIVYNKGGKVQVYRDILLLNQTKYDSRLYKIEILVKKDGEILERLMGYKSILK